MMVIFRKIVAELFDSMPVGPVLRTYMQYTVTVLSLPEVASDVIYARIIMIYPPQWCREYDGLRDEPTELNSTNFHICLQQLNARLKTNSWAHIKQEKPTNCGTKSADVLANFLAGKL